MRSPKQARRYQKTISFSSTKQTARSKVSATPEIRVLTNSEDSATNELILAIIFDCTEEELERKEHFTLRDIPTFSKLPAENAIKKDFKFDWIWEEEYRKDRPVTDFALTEADLAKIDLDKESRTFILDAIKAGGSREKQTSKESLSRS